MKDNQLLQLNQLLAQEDIGPVIPAADQLVQQLSKLLEVHDEEEKEESAEAEAESPSPAEEKTEAESSTEEAVSEATPEAAEATEETGGDDAPADESTPEELEAIRAALATYRERRGEWIRKKRAEEDANLALAKSLLQQFETLIKEEENIGRAYNSISELHEKWKALGDLPRNERQDLQIQYSKLNETFYYNINIYKELRENDLRKNLERKMEIIAALDDVMKLDSIQETEERIKALQEEWEEVGPTLRDEWEKIKAEYWTKVKSIYTKIRNFYDDRRVAMAENLKLKEALVVRAREAVAEACETHQDWEDRTKSLLVVQTEWKTIGFAARKDNERVWDEFRKVCDTFFNAKKEYYNGRNKIFLDNRDKKKALIEKAEKLAVSTEWKETSEAMIRLQKEWKEVGTSGQRYEHKLWRKFRGACDNFFNAKKAFYSAKDEENLKNLALKEALIEKVKAFVAGDDVKKTLQDLKAFGKEFHEIGHVPRKDKDKVHQAFKSAMDVHYGALKVEGKEKDGIMFQAKVDQLKSSPDANRLLFRESEKVRGQIRRLQDEIKQYENNLGFFANSKGAEKIIADVEKKIDKNRAEIKGLEAKLDTLG